MRKNSEYKRFTPEVPIEYRDGEAVQIVEDKIHPLYPTDVSRIFEMRRGGLSDDEISDWLEMV